MSIRSETNRKIRVDKDNPWVRQRDWLTIPDVTPTDEKFVGLFAVYSDSTNYCAVTSTGNYTVDWGDGVTENFNSGVTAYHTFNFNNVLLANTLTNQGYKQSIVTITPQAGQQMTALDICIQTPVGNTTNSYSTNWLDINLGSPYFTSAGLKINKDNTFYLMHNVLERIKVANFGNVTDGSYMFSLCSSLQKVILASTNKFTTFTNFFQGDKNLEYVDYFDTSNATDLSSLFSLCRKLKKIPLLNTSKCLNFNSFARNTGITEFPLLDTSKGTNFSQMCVSCFYLLSFPLLDTSSGTDFNLMLSVCSSLKSVAKIDTSKGLNFSSMFTSCFNIINMPELNVSSGTNFTTMLSNCFSVQKAKFIGTNASISYASMSLSKTALEDIFSGLANNGTAKTITITTNYGAIAAVTKSSVLTSGNPVVNVADTSNLSVGMFVTGTGVNTAVAITLQTTANTITRANHGLTDGTPVSFPTIVATTGLTIYTKYFVVNATPNTFQVALTSGGDPLVLTNNGTGTLLYGSFITNITPNTNVTLSAPVSVTGTQTLSYRLLNTSIATIKGWTVSG